MAQVATCLWRPKVRMAKEKDRSKMTKKEQRAADKRAARREKAKEKEEAVVVMMRKYKLTEEEVLGMWDDFYKKHPDGFMSKDSFLATKEVPSYSSGTGRLQTKS